jgi:Zn-dependent protease with chaperone function/tetratricopeptide (TPR) repeat protein
LITIFMYNTRTSKTFLDAGGCVMRKHLWSFFVSLIILGWSILPVHALQGSGQTTRDPEVEQQIYDQLALIDPAAVLVFNDATKALDRSDYETARSGYEKVLQLAPDFPPALRRLGAAYAYLGDFNQAESLSLKALQIQDSEENISSLANVFLMEGTPKSNQDALNLLSSAIVKYSADIGLREMYIVAAANIPDEDALRAGVTSLLQIDPNNWIGRYYSGLIAAQDGKWELAEKELLRAQELGVPADIVQSTLKESGIKTQASFLRGLRYSGYGLVGWLVLLGVLFLVGILLSRMTLSAIQRNKGKIQSEASFSEHLVRSIYRIVITFTSIYFYLSIPILILMVVAIVAGSIYFFLSIGTVPLNLALLIPIFGLYTIYAILRSLFSSRKQGDPGLELKQIEATGLWRVIGDVAQMMGTRPVQKVFLSPLAEIGVFERGRFWNRLLGRGERCLILGLGALPDMNQGQLRAILAHEYGHFNQKDTAGGDLANSVTHNILNMAAHLQRLGTATFLNPVWLFINGFYRIFLRITRGASRLQETLADRNATLLFGRQNMLTSLEHIVHQDLLFRARVATEVNAAHAENRNMRNLYTLTAVENSGDIETEYQKIMQAQTSPYDSHPSMQERRAHIQSLGTNDIALEDRSPVWELFGDSTGLQEKITRNIESNLQAQGVLSKT